MPPPQASPIPRYSAGLEDEILRGFTGALHRPRVPWRYRLGLVAAAITLLLLPVAYLAIIVATAAAAALYVGLVWPRLSVPVPFIWPLLALGPPFAAAVLVLFMIRSLLPRREGEGRPIALSRDREPVLFAFVDRLCATLRAPVPAAIHVDLQVNASAHLRGGPLGLLRRRLVLTFGLPLVSCFTLEELAGVFAHELGHFTQRGGMSLSYLVRSLDDWLARVATESYGLAFALAITTRGSRITVRAIAALSRALLGLCRRILWGLTFAGHGMIAFLMRQMELEADLCQGSLVGAGVFRQTQRDFIVLDAANERTSAAVSEHWSEGRLPDDLPALVAANFARLAPRLATRLDGHLAAAKAGFFDTHPAAGERLANVRRAAPAGVFRSPLPATALFRNFPALGRSVSAGLYRRQLGSRFSEEMLFAAAEVEARQRREDEESASFQRYFADALSPLRGLPLPEALPPPVRGPAARRALERARAGVEAARAGAADAARLWHSAEQQALKAALAGALLRAGVEIAPERYQLTAATAAAARRKQEQAQARMEELAPVLARFEQAVAGRLTAALALRAEPGLQPEDPRAGAAGCEERYHVLRLLEDRLDMLAAVRRTQALLAELLAAGPGDAPDSQWQLASARRDTSEQLHEELSRLRTSLQVIDYPFEHAWRRLSLGEFAIPELPPADRGPGGLVAAGERALDAVSAVHRRLRASFAQLGEQLESAAAPIGTEASER